MSQNCYDLTIHFDLLRGVVVQCIASQTHHLPDKLLLSGQISLLQRSLVVLHEHVMIVLCLPLFGIAVCDK